MPNNVSIADKHRALYDRIPKFKCIEGCTDCCGPVPYSPWEWSEIKDKRETDCLGCPYSTGGSCAIYGKRPMICRLFGAVEDLRCPHGCKPEVLLSREAARALLGEYQALGQAKIEANSGMDELSYYLNL